MKEAKITITKPDDWHLHLRDGNILKEVLGHTAKRFKRAIIMPNLNPPIVNLNLAQNYRQRICQAVPEDMSFEPLMTLYLNDQITKKDLIDAKESGIIYGVKLYPAGVTTNSKWGISNLANLYDIFSEMEKLDLPLLIHGELLDDQIDVFDREKAFIERHLESLVQEFSELRIVLEHLSTSEAVDFVNSASDKIAGTITAHHLLWNRNKIFENGIRPHNYCLPLLKTEKDRQALLKAILRKQSKFFLGTDSAPHFASQKESACGCAGIFSAPCALELYTQIFYDNYSSYSLDDSNYIEALESFSSFNGPLFYKLKANKETVTLIKEKNFIAEEYPVANEKLIPLLAGKSLDWKIV